jgi:hypothetical protein
MACSLAPVIIVSSSEKYVTLLAFFGLKVNFSSKDEAYMLECFRVSDRCFNRNDQVIVSELGQLKMSGGLLFSYHGIFYLCPS